MKNKCYTYEMSVNDYKTGRLLGTVELSAERLDRYEAAAQQPQGIISAGDVLSAGEMSRLNIEATQTIWLD